ncbi:MAG: hypothetical protein ABEI07_02505, partial [Candidatus Nanohaloarchaea archaeon]
KGVIHTVEAVLAAILFLFFLLAVMPRMTSQPEPQENVDRRVMKTLRTMDLNNSLRGPLTERNISEVKDRISSHIDAMSVEISALFLNSTTGHATFSSSLSRQFQVDRGLAERVELRIWFEDAESPNVSVNGNTVDRFTGTVDSYHSYEVLNYTSDGSNTFRINVSGSSEAGYTIGVYERNRTGQPPEEVEVFSTSYMVSGNGTSYVPVEVSVLSWR